MDNRFAKIFEEEIEGLFVSDVTKQMKHDSNVLNANICVPVLKC